MANSPHTHVQYTRPESSCLHPQADRVRSQLEPEMGARRLLAVPEVRLNRSEGGWRCWQTDSIGSVGDSSSWQESIGLSGKLVRNIRRNEAKQARYASNISNIRRSTHVIRPSWREPSAPHMWYGSFKLRDESCYTCNMPVTRNK